MAEAVGLESESVEQAGDSGPDVQNGPDTQQQGENDGNF